MVRPISTGNRRAPPDIIGGVGPSPLHSNSSLQDGNGRVARTLLTWHLVREGYLPVVIKRDDRDRYIDALESADGDDLRPFVDLLVQLQKQTILEALGEPESDPQPALVGQVLTKSSSRLTGRTKPGRTKCAW